MLSRRQFIRLSALAASSPAWALSSKTRAGGRTLHPGERYELPPSPVGTLDDLVTDENYWRTIQQSFSVDRSLIHLNNGGVCPSPDIVQQAEQAHRLESNRHPFYAYYGQIAPQLESIRKQLADEFGCDAEEIALTRNTSEGMEICQLGLALRPGDEIVTSVQDYPRMLATWEQRVRREGVELRRVPVPVPLSDPDELVRRFDDAITPRTRLVMCCHMVDLTGQLFPVRKLAEAAHRRGVPILVDGAQTFGHIPLSRDDLDCDFFATSLHKWIMGPQGTGMLYVRRERIRDLWPLMPAEEAPADDIRKFEDVGTHSPAGFLAVGEALSFHRTIGAGLKTARLRYLRDYWIGRVRQFDRVRILTHLPEAGSLATISIEGLDPIELRNFLWERHRIRVRPIRQVGVEGIRVSPALHTTPGELDRFITVMDEVVRKGISTT